MTLQEAIESLYRIAVTEGKSTSTLRLQALAQFCSEQLASRGLGGAETERPLPGGGREKRWDVSWSYDRKPRLAISLKSILKNLAGTVPNRIDDLMGEVTNLQMYSPEIVTGYLMVFDVALDARNTRHGDTWVGLLRTRLSRLSGRQAPAWSIGMVEGYSVIEVNFSAGPLIVSDLAEIQDFFDRLVGEVKGRNPGLGEQE